MTVEVIGQNLPVEPPVDRAGGPSELAATSGNSVGRRTGEVKRQSVGNIEALGARDVLRG